MPMPIEPRSTMTLALDTAITVPAIILPGLGKKNSSFNRRSFIDPGRSSPSEGLRSAPKGAGVTSSGVDLTSLELSSTILMRDIPGTAFWTSAAIDISRVNQVVKVRPRFYLGGLYYWTFIIGLTIYLGR